MKYILLKDSDLEPKATSGTFVYSLIGTDYGCSMEDTVITGKKTYICNLK